MKIHIIIIIALLLIIGQVSAQIKYAVLPVHSLGIDDVTTQTVDMLLRQQIVKETGQEVISKSRTDEAAGDELCMDLECAVEIGNKLNADKLVTTSLSKLGRKIVVQFMLFDVKNNNTILADNVMSQNIDDMEMVIIRISKSIAQEIPIEKSGEVGAIVKNEEKSLTRRRARRFTGISFGYLFPVNGYDGKKEEIFSADLRLGFEMSNTAVGTQFALRKGFAANIYVHYLLSRKDVCPYIGGALGFHWVAHDSMFENNKRTDGMELTASTGLRLFRTYNFQVMINLDYSFTFNDFDDQAIVFTIGLLK
jgi:hypothetical protein